MRKQIHWKTEIPTPSKRKQDGKGKQTSPVRLDDHVLYLCKLEQIDLKLIGYRNKITFFLPQGAVLIIRSHIRHAMHAVWKESDSYFYEKMTPKCVSWPLCVSIWPPCGAFCNLWLVCWQTWNDHNLRGDQEGEWKNYLFIWSHRINKCCSFFCIITTCIIQ